MIDQIYPSPSFLQIKTITPERREFLAKLGSKAVMDSYVERESQWRAIYQYGVENGLLGLTLSTTDQLRWAIITPDNQFQGSYRYSVFDRRGFFGHGTYPQAEKAVEAAFDIGYRCVDDMQRLNAVSELWQQSTQ